MAMNKLKKLHPKLLGKQSRFQNINGRFEESQEESLPNCVMFPAEVVQVIRRI